jgi:hypothetical protein
LPAFGGSLHFGIIDAIKEQKKELKRKIEKGERKPPEPPKPPEKGEWIYLGDIDKIYVYSRETKKAIWKFEVKEKVTDIIADSEGNLWGINFYTHYAYKFDYLGNPLLKFGGEGTEMEKFYKPTKIKIDKEDNVYIVDDSRVQIFNKNGSFFRVFGEKGTESGKLYVPRDIDFDKEGNIYILESEVEEGGRGRVQKFNNQGEFIKVVISEKNYLWLSKSWGIAIDEGFMYLYGDHFSKRLTLEGNLISEEFGTLAFAIVVSKRYDELYFLTMVESPPFDDIYKIFVFSEEGKFLKEYSVPEDKKYLPWWDMCINF